MTDLDKGGFGFQRARTYLGPTLGWKDELVQQITDITTGGTYNVKPGDSLILVDVAAPVLINLPDVVGWVQQSGDMPATGFDKSITIKDLGGNASNFNIVIAPHGEQTIDNVQTSVVLSINRAAVKFSPLIDMSGWAVGLQTTAGGGGGGGDVFKAGNNTFTGTNTFNGTTTVLTQPAGDNSTKAATTEFVKLQGYITGAALSPYALLASPIFTGDPRAPTPAPGDNDTSIATTAFVQTTIASFGPIAPIGAEYITSSANATLTAERVLTNTPSITWDFTTPGQAKASAAAGGGNVSAVNSPVNGQFARWVTPTTIEGISVSTLGFAPIASPVFTGDPQAPTPPTADNDTSIATTAFVKANMTGFQPLDDDLTAISGLGGTNTIYYRSAPGIWSPVGFSGLTFSGGILTAAASGGNVSNFGTPTAGQVATWTDATHIQGVAASTLGFAPIANPVFTGDPQAPTPATADNDTSIATTSFVKAQNYAPLASPIFTGDPQAPTPSAADNDTSIATTAFVKTAIGAASSAINVPQGRLTLQSGVPVMISTQATKNVVYYTPYAGNQIPIYNGTTWTMRSFSELNRTLIGAAAAKLQDWFVWDNGGTLQLINGPDWTDNSTRPVSGITALTGLYVNSQAIGAMPALRGTYVGTTFTYLDVGVFLQWKFGGTAPGGVPGFFSVWNAYNRVQFFNHIQDQNSFTIFFAAYRQYDASAGNQVTLVKGLIDDLTVHVHCGCLVTNPAGTDYYMGVGIDGGPPLFAAYAPAGYQQGLQWGGPVGLHIGMNVITHMESQNQAAASSAVQSGGGAGQVGGFDLSFWA